MPDAIYPLEIGLDTVDIINYKPSIEREIEGVIKKVDIFAIGLPGEGKYYFLELMTLNTEETPRESENTATVSSTKDMVTLGNAGSIKITMTLPYRRLDKGQALLRDASITGEKVAYVCRLASEWNSDGVIDADGNHDLYWGEGFVSSPSIPTIDPSSPTTMEIELTLLSSNSNRLSLDELIAIDEAAAGSTP